jgi:DNA-binding SARP family transcriptional activator
MRHDRVRAVGTAHGDADEDVTIRRSHVSATEPARRARLGRPVVEVELRLLDCFELRCDDRVVPLPMSAKRLLVFLALRPHPVLRLHVAGMLWPDSTEQHAFASLRSALWRVNQFGYGLVEATNGHLWMNPAVRVDMHRATALAHAILSSQPDLPEASSDWTPLSGDLLPDWTDEWILMQQERHRQLALESLEALSVRLLGEGLYGCALEVALAAVAKEPLRESAHRVVVRVQLAQGNISEVRRWYRFYAQLVQKHLGLAPSEQMDELVGGVLAS